ncbi:MULTISPECIES: LysR family transcriptional regulator [Lawsonibacter]|uniref:LysR family transcriptional regulator n=1 Tax=Lawsonibacter hominis TaxID=2763053 RepID=A0A8J6IZH1_9FIRM|nr:MULTISPECIES: LysR family transcriptional regulator [Lawsonibacter]MBC5732472.1 LysR family transcriptional regulator [Lawsonibacter hominis]MCI6397839.1 LysR family transcriptional regulator [Lawsonibacter sp.]MDY2976330.1 LysR family transcriptional regulator [Oscillospiraceae bacterium]
MEIRQLMYFIQIVKSGTYSAAAKQLYLSQPALSKAVKHLEEELGAKLLVQGDKRSEPTDVGRVLFERGQQLIREYNDLLGAVDEANSRNRGRLHFGIPYGLGQILFYRLTADFSRAFPEMELVVSGHGSAHIREEVLAGRLDIGATLIPPEPEPGLEATVIMRDQFFLLLPRAHPLAGREGVRFAQLREEQFILLNEEFVMTRMTRQSCAMAGFAPRVKIVANRSDFIAELVADGQGIAVIAGGRYRFEHDSRLSCAALLDGIVDIDIALITRAGADRSTAAARFVEFAQEQAHEGKL